MYNFTVHFVYQTIDLVTNSTCLIKNIFYLIEWYEDKNVEVKSDFVQAE